MYNKIYGLRSCQLTCRKQLQIRKNLNEDIRTNLLDNPGNREYQDI